MSKAKVWRWDAFLRKELILGKTLEDGKSPNWQSRHQEWQPWLYRSSAFSWRAWCMLRHIESSSLPLNTYWSTKSLKPKTLSSPWNQRHWVLSAGCKDYKTRIERFKVVNSFGLTPHKYSSINRGQSITVQLRELWQAKSENFTSFIPVCMCMYSTLCVLKSKDNFWSQLCPSTIWFLGLWLRSMNLGASIGTCWAVSLAPGLVFKDQN